MRASSVLQLVSELRAGRRRAVAVVEEHLDRLRALDEDTHCVVTMNTTHALETARGLDEAFDANGPVGPLHGVPFTVKDWIDVAGLPCSGGSLEHKDRRPEEDATAVARLRSAGGIVLAKTAILGSEGSPDVRNPHDTTRSPGGSSSGEAVAVAAGASPLGLGSDSGGSIRLPAAWCGVAGLKPSAGRVPNTGHFPRIGERSDGRTQIGPLASTVADLALALELIAGPDGRDPSVALVALGDPSSVDLSGLRVSSFISEPGWEPEDAIASAVEDATRALVSRGARPVDPPPRHLDESLDITRRYWRRRELSGEEAARQLWDWDRFRRRMTMWAEAIDVLVMPATPMRAPVMRPTEEEDYAFTLPASLTGWPAVTVPVGVADGLPVAVQIVATAWNDHIALAAAAAIEESVST